VNQAASAPDRDRDPAGRPKNARPRDGLGRPLPRGVSGEPVMPDDLRLDPSEAVRLAQRLIDEGRPFHAHEVLEARWKSAPAAERALWKGLAQIAVGLTHARRGNATGAASLLRRGAAAVTGYAGGHAGAAAVAQPAGLDLDAIIAASNGLADLIAAHGLGAVPGGDLRVSLIR
jgi:hypothetical protein